MSQYCKYCMKDDGDYRYMNEPIIDHHPNTGSSVKVYVSYDRSYGAHWLVVESLTYVDTGLSVNVHNEHLPVEAKSFLTTKSRINVCPKCGRELFNDEVSDY